MFKKRVVSITFVFILLCTLTFLRFMHVTESDKQSYEGLKEGKALFKDNLFASAGLLTQTRHHLRRDLLATRQGQRLHAIQYSDTAKMTFDRTQNALVEKLQNVRCLLQEKLHEANTQTVCEITAAEADYHYQNQQFRADNIALHRFELEGWTLPDKIEGQSPSLASTATDAVVKMGREPRVEASHFHGHFVDNEQLGNLDCQQIVYTPEHLHLEKDVRVAYNNLNGAPLYAINSKMLDIELDGQHPRHTSIAEVAAQDAVQIQYGSDLKAEGDVAVYQRAPGGKGFEGVVQLAATRPGGTCKVMHTTGSYVNAHIMTWNMQSDVLVLSGASGQLIFPSGSQSPVDFSADELVWDRASEQLQLLGQVRLAQGDNRWLRCVGACVVDLAAQHVAIESSKSQVAVHDAIGDLRSNVLSLDYKSQDSKIGVDRVTASGNVRLRRASEANQRQYAIADGLEYLPVSGELSLTANRPRRVIFLDKAYDMKISAPSVSVKRNPTTLKDEVKGLGDVRLSFVDKELKQLEELFNVEAFQ